MAMIPFVKMQGIGNDYLFINAFERPGYGLGDPAELSRRMSDRHFGVGADGLILLLPVDPDSDAHVRMRMFNSDGSEAEMCGNGIRCLCKLAFDDGVCRDNPMRVQTGSGILSLEYDVAPDGRVETVTVDMGRPRLGPVAVGAVEADLPLGDGIVQWSFAGDEGTWLASFVSVGNPHVVFFRQESDCRGDEDLGGVELEKWGAAVENHRAFPGRINAHWVHVISRRELTMRTWERGSGSTLACGTGATAVCAAAASTGRADRRVLVHLPGGDLLLDWRRDDDRIRLTGPAREVFRGVWDIQTGSSAI